MIRVPLKLCPAKDHLWGRGVGNLLGCTGIGDRECAWTLVLKPILTKISPVDWTQAACGEPHSPFSHLPMCPRTDARREGDLFCTGVAGAGGGFSLFAFSGLCGWRSRVPESQPRPLALGSAWLADWLSATSSGRWAGESEREKDFLWWGQRGADCSWPPGPRADGLQSVLLPGCTCPHAENRPRLGVQVVF